MCTACRIGTKRLLEMLELITEGLGTVETLDNMEELCLHIQSASLCALGQTAPNPVLSTLKYFREEYLAHVVEKRCPSSVCKHLLTFEIDSDKCIGCGMCMRGCPADAAISGAVKQPHVIDKTKCVKCGACFERCKFGAISKK